MSQKPEFVEIEVATDGTIRCMYEDGLAELIGAEIKGVHRASRVEFEEVAVDGKIEKGWTIRAEYDPELALRANASKGIWFQVSKDPKLKLVVFKDRAQALHFERDHFWELLPPKEQL